MKRCILLLFLGASYVVSCVPGCVTVQGGDKPIKVEVTVTHKIDQQLEDFYSYEKKYDQSTTQPTTQPGSMP